MRNKGIERKRIIVFGFEGKNNKTESNYFSHYRAKDSRFLIKMFSCGKTDPKGMINSAKEKRKDYDYNSREDLTVLFMDCDCDEKKSTLIDKLQGKQGKDLVIIKSNPCFELWFLNHFCLSTKEYSSNKELIDDLKKHIEDYQKNNDYYDLLEDKTETAVRNSKIQASNKECKSKTEVFSLFEKIIEKR